MNRRTMVVFLVLGLGLIVGCGIAADDRGAETMVDQAFAEEAAFDSTAPDFDTGSDTFSREVIQLSLQQTQVQERLIIRDGLLEIVVEDSESVASEIGQLVEILDGWVVRVDLRTIDGAKTGSIAIRVPADEYDTALVEIKALAIEVLEESTSSTDVTEDFVDLQARLANLEATADRVRNFLDESKTVEEALAVNQELSRLESEIESIKGRLQYLSQSAAYSTLTIVLTPDELSQPIEVAGWRPNGAVKTAVETLVATLQTMADALIWMGIFCLPLFLLVGIPFFFVGRFIYRRRRRSIDQETPADADEPEVRASDKS